MTSFRTTGIAAVGIALCTLAGCGGDSSAPTPTPVATSSGGTGTAGASQGSNTLPPAPFALQSSATFGLIGWQYISSERAPTVFAQAGEKAGFEWSQPDKTYRINLVDLGSGRLVYTFGKQSNAAAFSIVLSDGSTVPASVTLFERVGSVGDLYWQSAEGAKPFVYGRAIFGLPVPAGRLPTTGGLDFVGPGGGRNVLRVDFANRTVIGQVTAYHDGGGFHAEGPLESGTIEPATLQPDGSFVAKLTVAGAPRTGELRGRLFGPNADQMGVYWNAPARLDGDWTDWQQVRIYEGCPNCPP
ncbi:hypothetical protein A6F68_00032 [Tsuneonella dongtanensis]|uniref:Lipoprotein n=1 Tax=Tsuneonella dongtanensis TaxID=692370 RepID=A0A1B2A916_9SPHN|nr:hypothetical protein [Tsuneonella dongtanensis]ANY18568.1 hypothetical protein A6F68_00032 [Tsuneonella dongtanensis]